VVLGIALVNVLGLQAVLKLLQLSKDSEWPPQRDCAVLLLLKRRRLVVSLAGAPLLLVTPAARGPCCS
jgi:hypothetical protein